MRSKIFQSILDNATSEDRIAVRKYTDILVHNNSISKLEKEITSISQKSIRLDNQESQKVIELEKQIQVLQKTVALLQKEKTT